MNKLHEELSSDQETLYKKIFEKITYIEQYPGDCLRSSNFSELAYFLRGYIRAIEDFHKIDCDFEDRFSLFLKHKYDDQTNHNWVEMILYYGHGDKYAARTFFSNIELFKIHLSGGIV